MPQVHSMKGRVVGVAFAVLLGGCAGDHDEERDVIEIGEVSRVEVFRELRIDGHQADLVPIAWIGSTPEGMIAVVQGQDAAVRFFDSTGETVGAIGGHGEGPGEFQGISHGGWKADTLWVFDGRLRRATLMEPGLGVTRVLPPLTAATPHPADTSRLPNFPFAFPYAMYSGDSLLVAAQWGRGDPKAQQFDAPQLLRISSDGMIDEIVMPVPSSEETAVRYEFGEGGWGSLGVPFAHRPLWTVSSDGRRIATVRAGELESERGRIIVQLSDERGRTLYTREYGFQGEVIPEHVTDSVIRERAGGAPHPIAADLYRNEVPDLIPSVYPPVSDIMVDRDYRVWLRLRGDEGESRWLGISADGDPIGVVVMPGDVELYEAAERKLWGVETDELDVESVVVFSLENPTT